VSFAVQETVLVPTGNIEPEVGAHTIVTGACPPVVVGAL
jgi:hypothetical protein